jgi:hypothetical protein
MLHSDNGPDENRDGHYHNSMEIDSRRDAAEYDADNNHQPAESKVHDDPACKENVRRIGDPDAGEKYADDPHNHKKQGGHSDGNEAPCRNNLHAPCEGDDHTHDGHCHTDGCALFEILVYDPLGRKPVIECPCIENDHNHSELLQAVLQAGNNPPANWYNLPFRQKPYIDTYSVRVHSLIPGLRAPPAC